MGHHPFTSSFYSKVSSSLAETPYTGGRHVWVILRPLQTTRQPQCGLQINAANTVNPQHTWVVGQLYYSFTLWKKQSFYSFWVTRGRCYSKEVKMSIERSPTRMTNFWIVHTGRARHHSVNCVMRRTRISETSTDNTLIRFQASLSSHQQFPVY